jgi:dynein assembly factor 1
MALYLQENLIETMEGFDFMPVLHSLNLSDNMITKVEGLERLVRLETLQLKRNRFGKNNDDVNDLKGLLDCPSISVLDLSDNFIQDEAILEEVIYKMPKLSVLYLMNNPFCKKMKNYRKIIIDKIPQLRYLDDRPVFKDDRRYAEAFVRGGYAEERKEREIYKKEESDKHWANHEAFSEMIKKAKEEKRLDDLAKKVALMEQVPAVEDQPKNEEEAAPLVEDSKDELEAPIEVSQEEKPEEVLIEE